MKRFGIILIILLCILFGGFLLYQRKKSKFKVNPAPRKPTDIKLKEIATQIKGTSTTPIYILNNFLSETECNNIIAELQSKLSPSSLTRTDPNDPYFRTSSTGVFTNTKYQRDIDKKMSDIIVAEKNEKPQIQHYDISQQFKPHWDAFDPKYDKEYYDRGQRSWTFLIYLNDVDEGGETFFPNLFETITPQMGRAVIWYNLDKNGDLDRDTLHEGKPIIRGEKYIITKWFN